MPRKTHLHSHRPDTRGVFEAMDLNRATPESVMDALAARGTWLSIADAADLLAARRKRAL